MRAVHILSAPCCRRRLLASQLLPRVATSPACSVLLPRTDGSWHETRRQELVSKAAGLAFPVVNGIPNMLVSDARKLEDKPES